MPSVTLKQDVNYYMTMVTDLRNRSKIIHGYCCRIERPAMNKKTPAPPTQGNIFNTNDAVWARTKTTEPFSQGIITEDENGEFFKSEESAYLVK